jgi:NAD(P)-dependent dehydrogenase (short-subunit alcohol dehydrogenase family)
MDLAVSRAVVVGATGGLGTAVARSLVTAGASVAVAGRDPGRLATIAAERDVPAVQIDLAEPTSADQALAAAVAALGGLELVVCCAGTVAFGPVTDLDDRVLTALFETNVFGPIRLARAAIPLLAPGGALVNVSGVAADLPMAGMAAYSASKAAITAFDRALARELRRSGIRVLDVRPPHLATGLAERPLAGTAPRLGAGRDPADAARAIVTALADDATEVAF